MTLRDIDARDCCSREQCREDFPKASMGLTVRCDVCGRVWRFSPFLGWSVDRSPRCTKCGRAMQVPGVCTACAPVAVAPSPPRGAEVDGVSVRRRDRNQRWHGR